MSRDDRCECVDKYWRLIADLWRVLGQVLDRGAQIVMRIGATKIEPGDLLAALTASARFARARVKLVGSETSEIVMRQTDLFRPGARGCMVEVDCHFEVA